MVEGDEEESSGLWTYLLAPYVSHPTTSLIYMTGPLSILLILHGSITHLVIALLFRRHVVLVLNHIDTQSFTHLSYYNIITISVVMSSPISFIHYVVP